MMVDVRDATILMARIMNFFFVRVFGIFVPLAILKKLVENMLFQVLFIQEMVVLTQLKREKIPPVQEESLPVAAVTIHMAPVGYFYLEWKAQCHSMYVEDAIKNNLICQ